MLFLLFSCQEKETQVHFEKQILVPEDLTRHSEMFQEPRVIEVVEGIHVAVGFGLANSILIEGDEGNIIVDCMESNEAAARVKKEFNAINNHPVRAIIYTHNHADHIFGAGVMAGDDDPAVYAHELTNYYIDRLLNVVRPVIATRSYRMFGVHVDEASHAGCGIGPQLDANAETTRSLLRPNTTFTDQLTTTIAGVDLQLVHAPGETADQLYVWLPKQRVLLPGDNIYKAFPNLYTIRGTPYRDVKQWAISLDKMRYLEPEILIPSHTLPIVGKELVETTLRDYADGIRFVHDQTIRYMNKGLTPDEIVEKVILPEHLIQSPYLQEFYGRVDWSVRNVFQGYLGWFDGNSSTLLPMPPNEKARQMAHLAGGEDALLEKAKDAIEAASFQWALELTDYLMVLNEEDLVVQQIRYEALIGLGGQQSNPNARYYYLSQALELKGQQMDLEVKTSQAMISSTPLAAVFNTLTVNVVPEKCRNYDKKAIFRFTDVAENWSVHNRNGVIELQSGLMSNPDLSIETSASVWKAIMGKRKKPLVAIAKGELKIEGGLQEFREFMGKFSEE